MDIFCNKKSIVIIITTWDFSQDKNKKFMMKFKISKSSKCTIIKCNIKITTRQEITDNNKIFLQVGKKE